VSNETQERAGRLADDLIGAATRCELELHLQPEVTLEDGTLAGAEALLRWYHPTDGLFWPADVLPLAHSRGGLGNLTAWSLGTAAGAALRWPEAHGAARTCWVNIPGEGAEVSAEVAIGLVRRLELAEGRLGLHVPVTALVRALDGQSKALRGLPLSGIVLGRDVVRHTDDKHVCEAVVIACARAAQAGWDVSAVGVESWDEATKLGGAGVVRATGHLFGSAMRPDRMRWLLGCGGASWRGTFAGDAKGGFHIEHDTLASTPQLRAPHLVAPLPSIPGQRPAAESAVASKV
jgi:EAL domain-containing protein (putative c-di-GMP-specific phosphodiesterase class I)